jgi:phosphoglycerate-specific signal transduction histidine kinase
MERWQEIQRKYEDGQDVITKQLSAIDELNQKVNKLKEINNQIEFSWDHKYRDDMAKKERELKSLKEEAAEKCTQVEQKYIKEIKDLKLTFRDDVVVIDGELNK